MARYVDIECDAVTEVLPRRAFKTRQDIQDFLDNIPTADVAPVVHGKWIEKQEETYCPVQYGEDGNPILHKYTDYICNLCGRCSNAPEPYCHCGAKMDGSNIDG